MVAIKNRRILIILLILLGVVFLGNILFLDKNGNIYKTTYYNNKNQDNYINLESNVIEDVIDLDDDSKDLDLLFDTLIVGSNKDKEDNNTIIESPTVDSEDFTKEEKLGNDLVYEIGNSSNNCGIKNRGYVLRHVDNKYVLTISMGMLPMGGSSINVSKVDISGDEVTIYVEENHPKADCSVIQVITYPGITINFNREPSNIIVKSIITGEIYNETNLGDELY